ncbi:MAG: general secretion pathway protein GspE [Planctomycetia bacterium]|jgi:hypothetical protein
MALDVYRDWLGIKETNRPLTHYQLLRLKKFEDNTAKIRTHYRKMNTHVRKYSTGEFSSASQTLLNELAQAMLCLTDAQRKREYDATLGRSDEGTLHQRSFAEILLANGVADQAQIDKARRFAETIGLELRDAVMQQKLARPDVIMLAYAESIGLPYIELDDIGVAEEAVSTVPATTARQHSCVPVMIDDEQVLMASPNPLIPDVEEDLRLRFSRTIRTVLCTPSSINNAVTKYYTGDAPATAAAPPPPAAAEATPTKKEKKTKEKKPKEKKAKASANDTDLTKQRLKFGALGFNMGVIFTVVLIIILQGGIDRIGINSIVIAVFVGLLTGIAGFFVGPKLQ